MLPLLAHSHIIHQRHGRYVFKDYLKKDVMSSCNLCPIRSEITQSNDPKCERGAIWSIWEPVPSDCHVPMSGNSSNTERSFSTLNRIKSYLRSMMLHHLMVLHYHQDHMVVLVMKSTAKVSTFSAMTPERPHSHFVLNIHMPEFRIWLFKYVDFSSPPST